MSFPWEEPHEFTPCKCGCNAADVCDVCGDLHDEIFGTDRENRPDEDEFAPGECDGSGTCSARIHVHGCYAPHRSDECDSPDEYGHTDRENGSNDG